VLPASDRIEIGQNHFMVLTNHVNPIYI